MTFIFWIPTVLQPAIKKSGKKLVKVEPNSEAYYVNSEGKGSNLKKNSEAYYVITVLSSWIGLFLPKQDLRKIKKYQPEKVEIRCKI